jgi:hypothetical protein
MSCVGREIHGALFKPKNGLRAMDFGGVTKTMLKGKLENVNPRKSRK